MVKDRPLYGILNVAQDASGDEIAKSYRRMALQFHPDRNPDGEQMFKKISNAYAVLSDGESRRLYDLTGTVGDDSSSRPTMAERSGEMKDLVTQFYSLYSGSEEEVDDVVQAFRRTKGNFRDMVQNHLLFDNGRDSEVRRILDIVAKLIAAGRLSSTAAWKKSSKLGAITRLERQMQDERAEAEEALRELGIGGATGPRETAVTETPSHAPDNDGLSELRSLIQRRHVSEHEALMQKLESKYGSSATGSSREGKRPRGVPSASSVGKSSPQRKNDRT